MLLASQTMVNPVKVISTLGAKRCCYAEMLSGPQAYELLDGYSVTVGAKCFRRSRVLFQTTGLRAPRRVQRHCWRQMRPLRERVVPDCVTVGAKCFRCEEVLFQNTDLRAPSRVQRHCWRQKAPLTRMTRGFFHDNPVPVAVSA